MLSSQAGPSNAMIKRGALGRRQRTKTPSSWLISSLTLTSGLVIIGCVAASSISQQQQETNNVQQANVNQIQQNINVNSPAIPIATQSQEINKQVPDSKQHGLEQSQQAAAGIVEQQRDQVDQLSVRQARAEAPTESEPSAAAPAAAPSGGDSSKAQASPATPDAIPAAAAAAAAAKKESQPAAATAKKQSSKSSSSGQSKSPIKASSSSSSSSSNGKPRLQANLGSTILQGSVNQMSKHDAYSAIAEKHGALAQDAMRRSDKRRIGNGGGFGPAGIQKASGLGDIFNPVRQMSDGGLARTLGASMRSMMKSKYSVPAYVASALLGAVALMAFYESPISPLPVPPLPEAPAGRFPPEMPNLPPGTQVPFRHNNQQQQQQNYNQRSAFASGPMQSPQQPMMVAQHQQQVFFPAAGQAAQARSQSSPVSSSAAGAASAISQVASNLLNVAKGPSQNAQRKSGPDFDGAKSIFNPSLLMKSSPLLMMGGSAANSKAAGPQNGSAKSASSNGGFLSYFGFGSTANQDQQATLLSGTGNNNNALLSHQQQQAMQNPFNIGNNNVAESKSGQPASNAGFLTKFRSYFTGSSAAKPVGSHNSPGASLTPAANSPSESSYNRINFIQALMKDASNSLPKFLTQGSRKPASSQQVVASPSQGGAASNAAAAPSQQSQQSIANLLSGLSIQSSPQMLAASSRAADQGQQQQHAQPQPTKQKVSAQPSGLMKVAHALLDSFTSGIAQRNAIPSSSPSQNNENSQSLKQQSLSSQEQQQQAIAAGSPLQMASMVVSDLLANYPSSQQQQQQQQQSGSPNQQDQSTSYMMSPVEQQQQPLVSQAASPGSPSAQPIQEPLARSSDTADIVIASDDAGSQAVSQYNNQVTYSTSVQSQTQQQHLSQKQQQPQAEAHSASPISSSSSPSSSSSSVTAPASASSQPQPHQQHARKTRSVGPDFGPSSVMPTQVVAQQQPSRAAQINAFVDYVADSYVQNKLLINFVMNQVGLSQAVPYVEQILTSGPSETTNANQWN